MRYGVLKSTIPILAIVSRRRLRLQVSLDMIEAYVEDFPSLSHNVQG